MAWLRIGGFGLALLAFAFATHAVGAPPDPAARGLDAFVHGATSAPSGGTLRLDLETFGFAQITTPAPLGAVAVDAAWDPESFGEEVAVAPPSVHVDSDANGRATLVVPMPQGEEHELKLLLAMRHGEHARTRILSIARTKSIKSIVHVSQSEVVPGGTINAWVHVTRAASDEPVQNATIEVGLFEGSYRRVRLTAHSDQAGMALVRVPVPDSDDPSDKWEVRATTQVGEERTTSSATLTPRDETPGAPYFKASFDDGNVRAGAQAPFTVVLRDASGVPVAGAEVRYWIGQNGLKAPADDDAWVKASTTASTNLRGEIHAKATAPTVVAPKGETQLHLVVRGELEGSKISNEAYVPVASSAASATLAAEAEHVVPGVEQRLHLGVRDGLDQPVSGAFDIEGDGLKARVTTDAHGGAEITWRAPETLGAYREIGPCAGGVAATVRVRAAEAMAALRGHPDPFTLCVPIDRDARAIVVPEKRVVRAGEMVAVRIVSRDAGKRAEPWSVTLGRGRVAQSSTWIEDGARGGTITVPTSEVGEYDLTAVSPRAREKASSAHSSILVLPASIPHLEAKVVSGRVAPGGTVEVDAALTDEAGQPLAGTITALVVDLEGGGSLDGLLQLDTRTRLCDVAGARDRCTELLSGEPASEPMRRALLGPSGSELGPLLDPGASVTRDLDASFSSVLHSLEGAVYTASLDPDRLIDVRRGTSASGFSFNPELMTLTTAAMDQPPLTPGGESIVLGDLTAIDSQVTFDNVARRVSRYKMFKVLEAVRTFKRAHTLDAGEPALRDPNALVRRLVRNGELQEAMLVDPWGGTMQFVKSAGPPLPFINAVTGFDLRAPGPNGRIGDGDDVSDPFVRVVKSGTPYARAMSEDQLVDAKLDMEVADSTVTAWSSLMDTATGTQLGSGLGMIGLGEGGGGTGQGYGSGRGTLRGGSTRVVRALTNGDAFFQAPQRTDARGHVRFSVPLGDIETTWGLGLLALPDHAPPAATKLDLVASQPVSLAANAGAAWTAGDEMDVRVLVRNRTASAVDAKVSLATEGVSTLTNTNAPKALHVEAGSVASFAVRVRAARAGEAVLVAKLDGAGVPSDTLRFSWDVLAPGELVTKTAASWVEGTGDVKLAVDRRDTLVGRARLVLTRGAADALDGALASLEPDGLRAPESIADAMEVASRVARSGPPELHEPAESALHRASERLLATIVDRKSNVDSGPTWLLERRFRAFAPADVVANKKLFAPSDDTRCPPTLNGAQQITALGVLPAIRNDVELPCWETLAAEATSYARSSDEPTTIARALLAIADRPSSAVPASALADKLRALVHIAPSGSIRLEHGSRADRTLVYSALLFANKLGKTLVSDERLTAWITVDRDGAGSFGSPEATRAVTRALLARTAAPSTRSMTPITVDAGGSSRTITLGPSGVIVLGLGERTTKVTVHAGAGIVARLERPMLRSFANPPDASDSPLRLETTWPDDARANHIATLHVTMSSMSNVSERAIARIPLPPGASMVAPLANVTQIHGALLVTHDVATGASTTLDIPLRFTLAGHATIREARIVTPRAPLPRGTTPSTSITIH